MTATFGLQGVHEKGADEFNALLEDVHNAGLSGVVRVIGASLIVKIVETREMSVATHAGSSCLDCGRTSYQKCGQKRRHWQVLGKKPTTLERAAAARSVAKHRFRKREGERWRGQAALLSGFSRNRD